MSIFSGNETHIITLDDEHLHKDVEHSLILKPSNFCIPPDYPVGKEDFFEIDAKVHKLAKKRGLILDDSKYDGMATGLPFHIPFVVRRKHK